MKHLPRWTGDHATLRTIITQSMTQYGGRWPGNEVHCGRITPQLVLGHVITSTSCNVTHQRQISRRRFSRDETRKHETPTLMTLFRPRQTAHARLAEPAFSVGIQSAVQVPPVGQRCNQLTIVREFVTFGFKIR